MGAVGHEGNLESDKGVGLHVLQSLAGIDGMNIADAEVSQHLHIMDGLHFIGSAEAIHIIAEDRISILQLPEFVDQLEVLGSLVASLPSRNARIGIPADNLVPGSFPLGFQLADTLLLITEGLLVALL